jgi:hypothetical protein
MTPSDENDILHAIDPKAKILSKCKPVINILDYPSSKIARSNRIFMLSGEGKR